MRHVDVAEWLPFVAVNSTADSYKNAKKEAKTKEREKQANTRAKRKRKRNKTETSGQLLAYIAFCIGKNWLQANYIVYQI